MQVLCDPDGLSSFRMPDAEFTVLNGCPECEDEIGWQSLSLALDQGSDGVCAVGFLARQEHLVVEPLWCASHGSWRDFHIQL